MSFTLFAAPSAALGLMTSSSSALEKSTLTLPAPPFLER